MEIRHDKIILPIVLVLIGLVVLIFIFQQDPSTHQNEVIKVAYLPVVQSLPLFVAVEEGMFEEEGLTVEIERIESPNQIIDALISGNVDAGAPSVAAGIAAIAELKKPNSLKIYSLTCGTTNSSEPMSELLIAKDSEISSIQDLRGKQIGHIPGIQFSTVAKKILTENGVDPSEVTLLDLPVPNQLPTLASGGVAAVLTLEPVGTVGAQKNISRILVADPMSKYVADPWCGGAGVVSTKFIQERPEDAEVIVRVMRRAINKTYEDTNSREYLVEYLDMPEEVAEEVPLPPLMVSSEDLESYVEVGYQKFVDVFYEFNVTEEKLDVRELLLD